MPSIALPQELSGYRPQDVGLATHAAIATLAPLVSDLDSVTLSERVMDTVGALINGSNANRRRVLMLTASGHTAAYLRRFAPREPWHVLATEYVTGHSRTDLVWHNRDTDEVFYDEIKTHNRSVTALAASVVDQMQRQAHGGAADFGAAFVGVRLIPFGALHLVTLMRPNGARLLLNPTLSQPLRTTSESAPAGEATKAPKAPKAPKAQHVEAIEDARAFGVGEGS